MPDATASRARRPLGRDTLLVAVLTIATLQINGFAQAAALPTRVQDVVRHPWLGGLLPQAGLDAMGPIGPIPGDPIGLLLNALTLAALLLYLIADRLPAPRAEIALKWTALCAILVTALVLPTTKLILLRDQSGPASYTHDGGVIQTEAATAYFLTGRNPYVETYVETPMAEWGFDEFRTALYHYPYLPWTFVFSAPAYLVGQAAGFYDQRLVYLALMLVALGLTTRLAADTPGRLALVALLGLNPVMNLDLVFGQNDSFVLAWILYALAAWHGGRRAGAAGRDARAGWITASVCYGLACASKPTAWFFAPFFGLLLLQDKPLRMAEAGALLRTLLVRSLPALGVFVALVGPYLLWDWWAIYEDVWRWSNGLGETGYQIWGWGASNFILALGWVGGRFDQWPFLLLQAALALPLLLWFLWRQWHANTLANACGHYAVFLFAFFYGSRFLNENYLGFILAFLALAALARADEAGAPVKTRSLQQNG